MTQDKIMEAFERCAESYYEGDFAKYTVNGDYVNDQQQDDYVVFTSGYQACAAEMGKDMEKIADSLVMAQVYMDYVSVFHNDIHNAANGSPKRITETVAEALALADKWRG